MLRPSIILIKNISKRNFTTQTSSVKSRHGSGNFIFTFLTGTAIGAFGYSQLMTKKIADKSVETSTTVDILEPIEEDAVKVLTVRENMINVLTVSVNKEFLKEILNNDVSEESLHEIIDIPITKTIKDKQNMQEKKDISNTAPPPSTNFSDSIIADTIVIISIPIMLVYGIYCLTSF
jgi:hypothetical protein